MRQFAVFILLFLIALPIHSQAARELPKPKLIALYFYADWCPNCKLLSPILMEARKKGELDKKAIVFVTLNLTDKASIHQSILLSQALGVGDFVKQQGSGTGYVALLDAVSKKEITRFESKHTADDIAKTISDALL